MTTPIMFLVVTLKKAESSQQQTATPQNSHRQFLNYPAYISLYLIPITRGEINPYLSILTTDTARGYDEIPPRLLKVAAQYIYTSGPHC